MKILLTGANGLLGQKLVQLLSTSEDQCIATGLGANRNPPGNYTYVPMDITQLEDIRRVVYEYTPDAVIHTAAMTQVDDCEKEKEKCWLLNVTATENLAKICNELDIFLLHLSTDFIFDGTSGPYKEEDIPNPLSYYAESKLEAENRIQKHTKSWAIARTMLVYGIAHDMSRSNIILWVKKNLEEGKSIKVVNDQWRMPTLAEDLAEGCLLIVHKKATGIFHLSGPDLYTPVEMARETARYFGLDASLIQEVDGTVFTQPAKRPARTGFILDKAYNQLGYKPRTFIEGIAVLAKQLISK